MTRNEEFLLAVFSGILMAFGIHEDGRVRSCSENPKLGFSEDKHALAGYWWTVGDYIRTAQSKECEQSDPS